MTSEEIKSALKEGNMAIESGVYGNASFESALKFLSGNLNGLSDNDLNEVRELASRSCVLLQCAMKGIKDAKRFVEDAGSGNSFSTYGSDGHVMTSTGHSSKIERKI